MKFDNPFTAMKRRTQTIDAAVNAATQTPAQPNARWNDVKSIVKSTELPAPMKRKKIVVPSW